MGSIEEGHRKDKRIRLWLRKFRRSNNFLLGVTVLPFLAFVALVAICFWVPHVKLPRAWRRCPNVLVDIGVRGGKDLIDFTVDGGTLSDALDRAQLFPALFCVVAFEADSQYASQLRLVETVVRAEVADVDIRVGQVVADFAGHVRVPMNHRPQSSEIRVADGKHVIYNEAGAEDVANCSSTLPVVDLWSVLQSKKVPPEGRRIVRTSSSPSDASLYVRMVLGDSRLCSLIDFLIVELRRTDNLLPEKPQTDGQVLTRASELKILTKLLQSSAGCRTEVTVIGDYISAETSKGSDEAFYAVLSGSPTIIERTRPAANTWMRSVQHGKLAVFTNEVFDVGSNRHRALGHHVGVVSSPIDENGEKYYSNMQSWSHLVRVRVSWDLFMESDPSIKFLVLLDDDTFPFTPTIAAVAKSCMDPGQLQWAGAIEKVRLDNGDGGVFGKSLRETHLKGGGANCYFPDEEKPANDTKACKDVMCKGCPGIPQGGMVVMTRALVKSLRPILEECERKTQILCERCGSQRLYFCLQHLDEKTSVVAMRGVYRHPWRAEKYGTSTSWHGYPVSFHGISNKSKHLHTGTVRGDMEQLYSMVCAAQTRASLGLGDQFVTIEDLHDKITCNGLGYYRNGTCYAKLANAPAWCKSDAYTWQIKS